jgi:lipopolysaccharide export LptBFGC system permease protein LptF
MLIIQPYVISLMHVISNKLEKYKLARIIKKDDKKNDKINRNDDNRNDKINRNNVNISTNDIQLLIKLVTDKTINRNVYEKLIRKYNKKRVEKYNIYNNRIHDKNMRKDLDFLETLIKKKLDIDDARLFIVILLYYVKNSPNFQL